jgi:hypothetical protein
MRFLQTQSRSESDASIGTGCCATGYFLMGRAIPNQEGSIMGNSANDHSKTGTQSGSAEPVRQSQDKHNNNSAEANKSDNRTSQQNAQGGSQD